MPPKPKSEPISTIIFLGDLGGSTAKNIIKKKGERPSFVMRAMLGVLLGSNIVVWVFLVWLLLHIHIFVGHPK